MSLPDGMSVAQVTVGRALDALGTEATIKVTVKPDRYLVWAPTGDVIYGVDATRESGDQSSLTIALPHVDQVGFLDQSGQAVTEWAYEVAIFVSFPSKGTQLVRKNLQVRVGQDTVDLDLVPGGDVTAPVEAPGPVVLSVAGETGTVDAETLVAALDVVPTAAKAAPDGVATLDTGGALPEEQVPERLSPAGLSAAYAVVRKYDGSPLSGKVIVITMTEDETEVDNIAVYDDLDEVGA